MNKTVIINGHDWPVIEWNGERVITTEQLTDVYETDSNNVKNNFNRNKARFEKGKHYYLLEGDELRLFKDQVTDSDLVAKNASHLYLWTRQGASRHCKILDTEQAWEQFDVLETNYYNPKPQIDTISKILENPDFGIQLLTAYKEEKEKNAGLLMDIQAKDHKIADMRPKEIFADAVSVSGTSILIGELAKIIKQNGIDIGQNRLFVWLRENGYLISRKGIDYNMPTQKSMELELFSIKERTINNPDGSVRITKTVLVTGKGQQYFINKFLKEASCVG